MAASFTLTPDGVSGSSRPSAAAFTRLGNRRAVVGTLSIGGTYTNNGDALPATLTQFTPNQIERVLFQDAVTSGGLVPRFDPATQKLSLFKTGSSTGNPLQQVSAGAALSESIRVIVSGF